MATASELENLRRLTDGADGYTDEALSLMLSNGMTENQIAYRIWNEIAASSASLVDTSESGSSRKLSDLHKNALTMAATFKDGEAAVLNATIKVRTRKAVRG
jgi:hypothetical protein